MNDFEIARKQLAENSYQWLVTGVAGFIGSNLLEFLLTNNQRVVGLDNFATGKRENLDDVRKSVSAQQWSKFNFIEGDIEDPAACRDAVQKVDYVLHQAALGSVPRSIESPIKSNATNIGGFLNMLTAAKDEQVKSFVYAASSSTYGDHTALPKVEENIGNPLSPYAVTKLVNELYANVYNLVYGFPTIGLRYFNVFGKRQDPNGAYAAVIPRWIGSMISEDKIYINGDGETSRDFCHVSNAVQANILAALAPEKLDSQVFNVALGDRTTLNQLFTLIQQALAEDGINYLGNPVYRDFRMGDVRHSQASTAKIQSLLGYQPMVRINQGIKETVAWYVSNFKK